MSFTCQRSFGPWAGHCLRRPVSDDMPLRSGPRHCGQSLAAVVMDSAEQHRQIVARAASKRDFNGRSPSGLGDYVWTCRAVEVTDRSEEMFRPIGERIVKKVPQIN